MKGDLIRCLKRIADVLRNLLERSLKHPLISLEVMLVLFQLSFQIFWIFSSRNMSFDCFCCRACWGIVAETSLFHD